MLSARPCLTARYGQEVEAMVSFMMKPPCILKLIRIFSPETD